MLIHTPNTVVATRCLSFCCYTFLYVHSDLPSLQILFSCQATVAGMVCNALQAKSHPDFLAHISQIFPTQKERLPFYKQKSHDLIFHIHQQNVLSSECLSSYCDLKIQKCTYFLREFDHCFNNSIQFKQIRMEGKRC